MVQFVHAQTADEVVDKYIASLGGKEKLMSLKTVKMEGGVRVCGNRPHHYCNQISSGWYAYGY